MTTLSLLATEQLIFGGDLDAFSEEAARINFATPQAKPFN
jgi:hypothetical protein